MLARYTREPSKTDMVSEGEGVGLNYCSVGYNKGFRAIRGRLGGSSDQGHLLFVTDESEIP